MKIAIIGAGNVGRTLGERFAQAGHSVTFGVRDPKSDEYAGISVDENRGAAAGADVIILAVPYGAAQTALAECGDVAGKIVVDATNPLGMTESGLALTCGFTSSGAETIAAAFPGVRVVKCFNTTGFGNMADPRGSVMFVCGDDAEAVETVRGLAAEIGFDAISAGALSKSRLLEPLAMLWIHLAFTTPLGRDFAFRIERR